MSLPTLRHNVPDQILRRKDVRRRFDRAAATFDNVDFVHRHSCSGLLERLRPMQVDARRILDVGSATGRGSRELARRYRRARVVCVDLSHAMLWAGKSARGWFSKVSEVQADAAALPFEDGTFDLVIANMLIPWLSDPQASFAEIARVLRNGGVFAFATLGPDSLHELRDAWQPGDTHAHVNPFLDMHDIGDALVRAGLRDPVLDVDRLTVTYRDSQALFDDLTAAGARNALHQRSPALTGKGRFAAVREALHRLAGNDPLAISFELVFGHAWSAGPPQSPGEFRVSADTIGRIRR